MTGTSVCGVVYAVVFCIAVSVGISYAGGVCCRDQHCSRCMIYYCIADYAGGVCCRVLNCCVICLLRLFHIILNCVCACVCVRACVCACVCAYNMHNTVLHYLMFHHQSSATVATAAAVGLNVTNHMHFMLC